MSTSVFITATDTHAGKTWVTQHLIQALIQGGQRAKAIKPIACGHEDEDINQDVQILLHAQTLKHPADVNLYDFKLPASPHIAAQAEPAHIEPKALLTWCQQQIQHTDICLIEGVGGLMVPLNFDYLLSHWICDMPNTPVILVVGNQLGCINHALLSLEKLAQMQRHPAWMIINPLEHKQDDTQDTQILVDTLQPHLHPSSKLLISKYNKPETLQPILAWLTKTSHS